MTVAELQQLLQPLRQEAEILFVPACDCGDQIPTSNIDVDQSDSDSMHFLAADETPRGTESHYYIFCRHAPAD